MILTMAGSISAIGQEKILSAYALGISYFNKIYLISYSTLLSLGNASSIIKNRHAFVLKDYLETFIINKDFD